MSVPTYLDYSCVPTLLKMSETQDLLIIGTLKTRTDPANDPASVNVQSLKLDFGSLGGDADNLGNTPLDPAQVESPQGWAVSCEGLSCTLTPGEASGKVSNNAIVIRLKGVVVNDVTGNVSLTITEVANANAQPGQNIDTQTYTGIQTIVLPKIEESEYQPVLTVQPKEISPGENCTLSWSGGDPGASYSLEYIYRNKLYRYPEHGNGNELKHTDCYPDQSKNDDYLIPDATTHFILTIHSSGKTRHLSTVVLVSQPNLHAESLHVQYPGAAGKNGILISENEATEGQPGNGITIVTNDDSPADPLRILKATGDQLLHVDKSANTVISGSLDAGVTTINGDLTVTGNNNTFNGPLNVNGNLTINGNIVVNGRGAKTFLGTFNNANHFKDPQLFIKHDRYYQFEFVFHQALSKNMNDESFGARFYTKGQHPYVQDHYQSNLYGNDRHGNGAESYDGMNFLRLYSSNREGPDQKMGLFGKMTLYKSQGGFSCSAHLYAPHAKSNYGCQIWVEGGLYPMASDQLEGIEFNYYGDKGRYSMLGGWIDIYGYA